MKRVELNKEQFDKVFYRAMTSLGSKDPEELGVSVALKYKLRKVSESCSLSPEEILADKIPNRELVENSVILILERDEHALARKKMKAAIPMFTGHIDELVLQVWEAVDGAVDYIESSVATVPSGAIPVDGTIGEGQDA